MPTLREGVQKGFEALGLTVEGERGSLTVTDGLDGQRLAVRIDENERVVRVEGVICYPVDDFPADLSHAMDWLNRARGGVCFAYDAAQRALVVSTAWSSPSREPSPNQLHLLVGLVQEACGRDGPQLERVAEGEAGWEVVAGDEAEAAAASAAQAGKATTRFTDRVGDESTDGDELDHLATRVMPNPAPPARGTTKFMADAEGGTDDFDFQLPQPTPRAQPKPQATPPGGVPTGGAPGRLATPPGGVSRSTGPRSTNRYEELDATNSRAKDEPPPQGDDTKRRMSRTALQMAVHRADHDNAPRQDLTRGGGGGRFVKALLILVLLAAGGWALFTFFIEPFFPDLVANVRIKLGGGEVPPDLKLVQREKMQPRELLLAELTDPLAEPEVHQRHMDRALTGLGAELQPTLEGFLATSPSVDVRNKAYQLWVERGFAKDEVARMRVLKIMVEAGRPAADPVDTSLAQHLGSMRSALPSDKAMGEALAWAKGPTFTVLCELLGRPGDGAEERSKLLGKHLDRDTQDLVVLKAMVATGFGPPDSAARLVTVRGLEWARGTEGRPTLVGFVTANPDSVSPLLKHQDEEFRLCGVDLLVAAGTPGAIDRLGRGPLRDPSQRVRIRAARGLGQLASPSAAWPLASTMAQREWTADAEFQDECRRALQKLPATEAAAELKQHAAPTLPVSERYYAAAALTHVTNAGGAPALISILKDPDAGVRRRALQALDDLAKVESNRRTLEQGLASFREVALRDQDQAARQAAVRLYRTLTGKDPS